MIAVGGILHESNSFHSVKTKNEDFRRLSGATAEATLDQWADNLDEIAGFAPRQAYLTHMGHTMDYDSLVKTLPLGVAPAYDGLSFGF